MHCTRKRAHVSPSLPHHVFLDSNPLIKLNIEPETKQFSEILFIQAQRMCNMQLNGTLVSSYSPCCSKLADLGFLKGGFRFRRITVIAWIISSWQASMSMQRLRSWNPSARSAEHFRNFGPLRSHLLAFQAPYSKHWSGGRRNCCICSTAPVGLIASFCSWLVKLTILNFTATMPTNFYRTAFLFERICRQN